jgi:drug/metabolite transporter (DMT)-like permease
VTGDERSRLVGYGLVAAAACAWGTWPLILRTAEAMGRLDPALEAVILMAVLTLVAAPFSAVDRVRVRADARAWRGLVWLGIGDAMNVILLFAAYQKTRVAVAVLTHYLTPIFVALAAPLVLKERTSARTVIAAAISFTGLVLLLAPWSSPPGGSWIGAACGAGSAVFYASNVLVNKRLAGSFSASELMFYHGLIATPLLALFVPHDAWAASPAAMAVVAAGGIGPGALGGLVFTWGLRRVPASHASTLTLLEPLVALLIGAFVYAEHLERSGFAGAALILVGAAVVVAGGAARQQSLRSGV